MYGKERSGTVPGAVATGSLASGRYRSRQYRAATMAIKRIARQYTHLQSALAPEEFDVYRNYQAIVPRSG
jgi:hypothetical protein